MRAKDFNPQYTIHTDDNEYLLVMLAMSKKHGEKSVFSVSVDRDTGRVLGSVVESRIRVGYNDALYFSRNKKRYYLSWLKPLTKRVDKK
mgnify:CR=1 FL=1|jgi:hypothetical protein